MKFLVLNSMSNALGERVFEAVRSPLRSGTREGLGGFSPLLEHATSRQKVKTVFLRILAFIVPGKPES